MTRNYSAMDLLRFKNFCKESQNYGLKPFELIKAYDETYPELSSKEKLINLSKVLGINNLHKTLTGEDISETDLIEWGHKDNSINLSGPSRCDKCGRIIDCFSGKCGCNEFGDLREAIEYEKKKNKNKK